MTRPMPRPPQWLESAGLGDCDNEGRWRNRWNLHWEDGRAEFDVLERHDKRLTDAECWAEYHHADAAWAKAMLQVLMGYRPMTDDLNEGLHCQIDETGTWHRFAAHPHALEES